MTDYDFLNYSALIVTGFLNILACTGIAYTFVDGFTRIAADALYPALKAASRL